MGNIVRELVQRADSWVNAMTGLGTLRDKLMHARVQPGSKLDDATLEALFNDDDVARRVVAKLPREATRRGFYLDLEADPDEDEPADITRLMEVAFAKLEAMQKLREGWIWARLYGGGSGVFVGADDGRPVDQPLNEAGIRSIQFLNVVKRPQLSVRTRYEDLQAPNYGKPEIYLIGSQGNTLAPREGLEVHETRLILFGGAMTACMTQETPTGFQDSVLQATYAPLQQTATAWQSIAHLMTDASQGVLKIANLVDLVAAGGQETLRSRIQLMDLARSVCRAILVDAEKESFERVSTSFAGLPEVMDRLMQRMCAAAEQPATLLYGRSPAGMNATGESDIRGWYDSVAEAQADELKPRLERLLTLMFLAKDGPTQGELPEQWCIEFNPLWQPTDKEKADTDKVVADTYVALVTGNIMTDAEAGLGLASTFPSIDVEARTELAEADKEEGLRPRETNTPEPEPEPDPDDPEGGGGGAPPREDSNQPRVPAGSPRGGQWTSSGGGGARAAAAAAREPLTEAQRAGIRREGTAAVMTSLQQKLVQRYGVPAKQAAILYERDIKAQLKAAKTQRAAERAVNRAEKERTLEALDKSKKALGKAIEAKKAADAAAAAGEAKKRAQAADKRKERNEKARKKRAEAKQKKLAEANEKRKAEEAKKQAEQKPPEPKKNAGTRTLEDVRESFTNGGDERTRLEAGHATTTRMVKDYLGVDERPAFYRRIDHKNLDAEGWGGYNEGGAIMLHTKHARALQAPPKRRDVEALRKEEHETMLERSRIMSEHGGTWNFKPTPEAKKRYEELGEKQAKARKDLHAARDYEEAQLVMVHEELHSYGPMNGPLRGLYRGSGVVAEEVATEILARDVVHGAGMRAQTYRGAYQRQVDGVLEAMKSSATNVKRTREERIDLLVQASKSYKQAKVAEGADLMTTLYRKLRKHAPDLHEEKLFEALNKVKGPKQS